MNNNLLQQKVRIDHANHVYYDSFGNEYISVTRFLSKFQEKTDFEMIAGMVAKKRKRIFTEKAKAKGMSVEAVQKLAEKYKRGITKSQVLKEWDMKRDEASAIGSYIHDQLEKAGTSNAYTRNGEYSHYCKWFIDNYGFYPHNYYEQIVYLEQPRIAGLIDFSRFRTSKKGMFDIRDFKTNDYKLDSTLTDEYTGQKKHYNRYMCNPVSHLEDCDFTKYVLQQSMYMYMAETTLGFKPGNLAVIHMPWRNPLKIPHEHIMPYMKMEVIEMINCYSAEITKKESEIDDYHQFIKL